MNRRRFKSRIRGIKKKTLEMILEASKENHPKEFSAVLRAKDGIITEIMLLPGTVSGNKHAIMQLHMLPVDFSVVGTIHSHPSPNFNWSRQDLQFFQKFGGIHIITCYPYDEGSWRAYDLYGNVVELEVVD